MLRDSKIIDNIIFKRIVILALALMAALSLYAGAKNAFYYSQDFQWDAAKALMLRLDPYELSQNPIKVYESGELTEFYRLFTDMGLKQKMEANQFPSLLYLLAPYTFFSPFAARILWLVSNLLYTAGIIWLLRKTVFENTPIFDFTVMMLLMLAGTPYRNQLGVGQHTIFSFFFFLLAVYFERKRVKGGSIFVTLALFVSFFKYTLTAPLAIYFVYKKRYKELAASVAMHIALTFAAAFLLKKSVLYMLVAPLKVSMWLSSEGGLDVGAVFGGGVPSLAIGGLMGIGLLVLSLKLPESCDNILIAVIIFVSLIMTYHRTYDFFVMSAAAAGVWDMSQSIKKDTGKKSGAVTLQWGYFVLIIAVYFVLRIFGENVPSRVVVGTMYYVFTAVYAACCIWMVTVCSRSKAKSKGGSL